MARNIKYQLLCTINKNFKEGMDKHSEKKQKERDPGKIHSYEYRKNLVKFSNQLGKYITENFNDVKLVKDIKSEHIQSFLISKEKGCTQNTLNDYLSYSNKMCNLINKTYKCNNKYDLARPVSQSSKQNPKDKMITREHYDKLYDYLNENGKKAVELSSYFGLRAGDCTKLQKRDIDLENREIIVIGSKGGRDRTVPIETPKQWEIAVSLKERTYGDEYQRVVPIQRDSVIKEVNRKLEKIELSKEYTHVKLHGFRKLYAQETYDRYRDDGISDKESLGRVSEHLGHSEERGEDKELQNTYVKNRR